MHRSITTRLLALLTLVAALSSAVSRAAEEPLRVLFLGDQGHHRPADRFAQLQPVLAGRGCCGGCGRRSRPSFESPGNPS